MEIGSRFEIVRVRNFVSHDHGRVTDIDKEITIRSAAEPSDHILLESGEFLPSLRMSDSSGEEYPLMPSKHLRIMLEDAAAAGNDRPRAARLLADINSRKTHLLWFRIPPHKTLRPNETRILHLTYEHPKKDDGPLGGVRSLMARAITIKVSPALSVPTTWVLSKPGDYNISRRRYMGIKDGAQVDMGSWDDNADAVFCNDTEKSTSLHVKPDRNGAVLHYSLTPKKIVLAVPVAAIAMLSLLAASVGASPHVDAGSPLRPIADAIVLHALPILLFIAASSLVVPRLIDDAYLRGALLWMYFVPVGLALCSLVLW